MKLIKPLLILAGVLFGATVALAVFLPFYFDPNDYKEQIAAKVKEQTGRDLTLKGDISLSVFPWLGVELEDASLSNAPGFGQEPFAAIRMAEVRVKLLPLLRKEIEVGTVVLDGLVLRLQKNAVGLNNWDDISSHKKSEPEKPKSEKDSDFKLASTEVAALEIKDSSVLWSNTQSGSRYELQKFNFSTGRLRSAQPFLLKSGFTLIAGKPAVTSEVEFEGKVAADLDKKTYRIENFLMNADVLGESLPGGKQRISLEGAVDANLDTQKLVISDLVLEALGLKVTGTASGSQILDKPVFRGQIKANDINPRSVMKAMGKEEPNTTDSGVLKNASFESNFEATSERADLQPIRIKLDDSNLEGSLSVANYSKPAIGFNLKVDQLDIDRYLSPPDKSKDAAGAGDGKVEEGEISVDAIKDLNLNGSLSVGKLKLKNLNFDNANLSLRSQNGVMVVEPFTANFYQGRINLVGRVDARGSRPVYGLNAQTSSIKIEPMLTALNGSSKINGTGTINLNLNASGNSSQELKRTSSGNLDFNLRDGEIKGVNVGQKLRQAYALYKGEKFSDSETQSTDFAEIVGHMQIQNGVLQNDDLDAKSPGLRLGGSGSANLVAETINYLAKLSIVNTAKGQGGEGLEALVGKTIPVRLTGSLYDPEWKIDLASVLQDKINAKIDEKKEEAKQKLQDKLMEKLGGKKAAAPAAAAIAPATTSSPSTAPAAQSSTVAPKTEAEKKAEKKAAKKAAKEEALRKLLGAPKEEGAPAPAPPAESAPAPAAEPAPAPAVEPAPTQ